MALILGAEAHVRFRGHKGRRFPLKVGVKQGSVLSPILFNIFFGAVIWAWEIQCNINKRDYQDLGIRLDMKRDGGDVTTELEPLPSTGSILVRTILFADDMKILAGSASDLQVMVTMFDKVAAAYGLLISTTKTKVMMNKYGKQRCLAGLEGVAHLSKLTITVHAATLEVVDQFTYLGRVETSDTSLNIEIETRCQRMAYKWAQLAGRVFKNLFLSVKTRLHMWFTAYL